MIPIWLLFIFSSVVICLISSSQPGGQPANLQGIWNQKLNPAWKCRYTTNINAEMNYWPAEVTNLREMHEPFLQMVKDCMRTVRRLPGRCMVAGDGYCITIRICGV